MQRSFIINKKKEKQQCEYKIGISDKKRDLSGKDETRLDKEKEWSMQEYNKRYNREDFE